MKQTAIELLKKAAVELGLKLTDAEQEKFSLYADELKKWNKKINLTAIKTDEEIAIKHFTDSLTLARFVKSDALMLDIGSGAGFPCIPLKITAPDLKVTSIDAVEKKIYFQRHVARLLGLVDFEAIHGRGEELKDHSSGKFDIVVSRAFSDISTFAAMALPLLNADGIIIAMKGKEGREEAAKAEELLEKMGATVVALEEFRLPIIGDARSLVMIGKKGHKNQ